MTGVGLRPRMSLSPALPERERGGAGRPCGGRMWETVPYGMPQMALAILAVGSDSIVSRFSV